MAKVTVQVRYETEGVSFIEVVAGSADEAIKETAKLQKELRYLPPTEESDESTKDTQAYTNVA